MGEIFDIAIFGTSLTTELQNRNWPQELQKTLQVGKHSQVRVHAVGKGSQTSQWGLANVDRVTKLKPRVAIVEFINDANVAFQMYLSASQANFEGIIDAIRAHSPETVVYLSALIRPRFEYTAPEGPYRYLTQYYALLPVVAASKGVGFLDGYAAWGDPALHPEDYAAGDGLHPLLSGFQRVVIPMIAAEIGPMIP